MNIVGLILAAGESSRMGSPKALLEWEGKPLIQYHIEVLNRAGIFDIAVVLGSQADKIYPFIEHIDGIVCVYNPEYHMGKTTSIKAGLVSIDRNISSPSKQRETENAVMILNVDQPRTERAITAVVEGYLDAPSGVALIIPTYQGKGGHPIILTPGVIGDVLQISENERGLKQMKSRYSEYISFVEINMPEILIDLNTRQDYETAIRSGQSIDINEIV